MMNYEGEGGGTGSQQDYKRPLLSYEMNENQQQNCSINSEDHDILEEAKVDKSILKWNQGVEDLENNLTRDASIIRPRTVEYI